MRLVVIALAVLAPSLALAQPGGDPGSGPPGMSPPGMSSPQPPRIGGVSDLPHSPWMFSGSAGVALRSDGGLAVSLTAGRRMGRFTAVADLSVLGTDCEGPCPDDPVSTLGVIGAGLHIDFGDRWWARATTGIGFADVPANPYDSGVGLGYSGTVGLNLFRTGNVEFDGRVTLIGGFFENIGPSRLAAAVGLTF